MNIDNFIGNNGWNDQFNKNNILFKDYIDKKLTLEMKMTINPNLRV